MTDTATPGPVNRAPGLRGRKPAVVLPGIHTLDAWLTTPLPAPIYPIDVTGGVPESLLSMLGNGPDSALTITTPNGPGQPVGDCFFAGAVHKMRHDAAIGNESEATIPDSNETVDAYDVYDDNVDEGVVMANAMQTWFAEGFKDSAGNLVIPPCDAFVRLLTAEVDAAMSKFNTPVLGGFNLTDNCDQLFSEGQPFTLADNQPDLNEGHVMLKVKSEDPSLASTFDTYDCWGAYQLADKEWTEACAEEWWLPITKQMAADANMNLEALLAAIKALGGEVITNPNPPTPTPVPPAPAPPQPSPPKPSPAPAGLAQEIEHEAEHLVEEAEELAEEVVEAL